jgi:hypothetical protein
MQHGSPLRCRGSVVVGFPERCLDPGVKYPPYSEHTREREVMDKLL